MTISQRVSLSLKLYIHKSQLGLQFWGMGGCWVQLGNYARKQTDNCWQLAEVKRHWSTNAGYTVNN